MENRKYGLQLRGPAAKKATQPKPVVAAFFAAHNDDDDDDEDSVERQIAREAARQKKLKEVGEQHKRALEQDPNVFDYDAAYDDMKAQQARPTQDVKKQSKYIPSLLKTKEDREKHHELVFERKQVKERAKDDHLYMGKEKFVTGAYKRKLEERRIWQMEEELRERREKAEDVTKRGDLTDFYLNLVDKNVAFGAATKPGPKSDAPEDKVDQNSQAAEDMTGQGQGDAADEHKNTRADVEDHKTTQADADDEHKETKPPVEDLQQQQADEQAPTSPKQQQQQSDEQAPQKQSTTEMDPEEARKLKEAAARERYLARKKMRQAP